MTVKIISKWRKGNKTCNLVTIKEGGRILYKFTGWNPKKVKGYFESSYQALSKWMTDSGWSHVPLHINSITIIN